MTRIPELLAPAGNFEGDMRHALDLGTRTIMPVQWEITLLILFMFSMSSQASWCFSARQVATSVNVWDGQTVVIRLEDVKIDRTKAVPGDTLTLTTTYTILTPENVPIPLTISRELLSGDKSLGRVQAINSNNKNGTYVQNINFTLPADAAPGAYTVVTRVSTGYGMDEKRLKFTVH